MVIVVLERNSSCIIPSTLELFKGLKFKFRKHILFSRSIYADLYLKKFYVNPIKNVNLIQSVFFYFKISPSYVQKKIENH